MFKSVNKIHFVGIGGIGMSGIAEVLLNSGFLVSGSDVTESVNTEYLRGLGIEIFTGHDKKNIRGADVVVYSSAVDISENPETTEARLNNIPILRRAEMLAEVARLNYSVAISGTHGKTTTTSMLGLILIKAGIDPTVIVGGRLKDFGGTNARLGKGKWTVVEADEYDRSFLQLTPTIAVINNVEAEHMDVYRDIDDVESTFAEFGNKVPFYGFVALGLDDDGAKNVLARINKKIITYGFSRNCDLRGEAIEYIDDLISCRVYEQDVLLGNLELRIPGKHNMQNALAAVTVARSLDVKFSIIAEALREFAGVYRRFETKGSYHDSVVIDDYAHHPSEVKATLEGASRFYNGRIVCLFQPHTFSRTRDQYKEFAKSFGGADVLIVMDIYAAREKPIEGIKGEMIADSARDFGHKNVHFAGGSEQALEKVKEILRPGDTLITMGAGDVWKIGEKLISESNNK
jgi:UDP-N-acetylmuramate--alanine ligase